MQRIRVSGPGEVAAMLRTLADGVAAGDIRIGDGSIACSAEVSAVIEVPSGAGVDEETGGAGPEAREVSALTVSLHPRGHQAHRHLGIEQELTHPGG